MNQEIQSQTSFFKGKNIECDKNINEFISTFISELKDALQNYKANGNLEKINLKEFNMEENSNLKNELETEYYTIDRFEGEFAVCENRQTLEMVDIPKNKIPQNAKEGQILKMIDGEFELDLAETNRVENEIKQKYNHLWED